MSDHTEPMDPAEVLAMAEAFDPLPESAPFGLGIPFQPTASRPELKHEAIMRLALQMILAQCGSYQHSFGESIDCIQRTAERALRECGN